MCELKKKENSVILLVLNNEKEIVHYLEKDAVSVSRIFIPTKNIVCDYEFDVENEDLVAIYDEKNQIPYCRNQIPSEIDVELFASEAVLVDIGFLMDHTELLRTAAKVHDSVWFGLISVNHGMVIVPLNKELKGDFNELDNFDFSSDSDGNFTDSENVSNFCLSS